MEAMDGKEKQECPDAVIEIFAAAPKCIQGIRFLEQFRERVFFAGGVERLVADFVFRRSDEGD